MTDFINNIPSDLPAWAWVAITALVVLGLWLLAKATGNTNKKTTIIKGVNQSSSFASSQQVAEIIHNHDSKPKSDQGE
ncbi:MULTISPECIES: hypothetical protein [Acinetobacter calcoaceticus/baumannii complex]|jgi:hypothetical protein|uniref:hypothetical protein n=1 Tax=Acinetobacter calcoaceticus/baumannii complex TaxID=909768 RepID=UPI00165288DC|nr:MULTISPECIES: hypothetical protein [Acinetobacter calcoaceticus/baumannii complex]MBC6798594.1 hypothetical protein [Acinetobacter baumannii]MBO2812703.1 hypothetical protein [Acinetobacter baumannii]MBO2871298.1 hypothetical protein [Acinetobacter baumannii]MBO3001720.1 hypothetical protein [Acinetobacter baumannii]QNX03653.1 hypothetical protein IC798_18745 [Acinetobacter seifertii]